MKLVLLLALTSLIHTSTALLLDISPVTLWVEHDPNLVTHGTGWKVTFEPTNYDAIGTMALHDLPPDDSVARVTYAVMSFIDVCHSFPLVP